MYVPDPLDASAGLRLQARIRQGYLEVLLFMATVEVDVGLLAEANREIVVHRLVIQEIVLDHVAAISQAQDEFAETRNGRRSS